MSDELRVVDGLKIAFVRSEDYFVGFHTPSMYSTAKRLGADVCFLLEYGSSPEDMSDDDIRKFLDATKNAKPVSFKDIFPGDGDLQESVSTLMTGTSKTIH